MKLESPKGDLSKRDDQHYNKFFKRQIKAKGDAPRASDYLPVRPFAKAGGDDGYGK